MHLMLIWLPMQWRTNVQNHAVRVQDVHVSRAHYHVVLLVARGCFNWLAVEANKQEEVFEFQATDSVLPSPVEQRASHVAIIPYCRWFVQGSGSRMDILLGSVCNPSWFGLPISYSTSQPHALLAGRNSHGHHVLTCLVRHHSPDALAQLLHAPWRSFRRHNSPKTVRLHEVCDTGRSRSDWADILRSSSEFFQVPTNCALTW